MKILKLKNVLMKYEEMTVCKNKVITYVLCTQQIRAHSSTVQGKLLANSLQAMITVVLGISTYFLHC